MTGLRFLDLWLLALLVLGCGAGAQSNLSEAVGRGSNGEEKSARKDIPGFQDVFESIGRAPSRTI
jgi:hypothetical protein